MDGVPARFRDLDGLGLDSETALHDAGIHTWEALAAVLSALSPERTPGGNPLRDLVDQVAERVSGPDREGTQGALTHRVELDAGRAPGGRPRDVELSVATGGAGFDYRARLVARPYGDAAAPPVEVGALAGTADGSGDVSLRFPDVDLPQRLQRLTLRVDVRLPRPGPAPALSLTA